MRNYVNNCLIVRVGVCQAVDVVEFGGHGLEAGLARDAKDDRWDVVHGVWRALGAIGCIIL